LGQPDHGSAATAIEGLAVKDRHRATLLSTRSTRAFHGTTSAPCARWWKQVSAFAGRSSDTAASNCIQLREPLDSLGGFRSPAPPITALLLRSLLFRWESEVASMKRLLAV